MTEDTRPHMNPMNPKYYEADLDFTLIARKLSHSAGPLILRDNTTGVEYILFIRGESVCITPRLNPDGTLHCELKEFEKKETKA